jgi:hypothetical protein
MSCSACGNSSVQSGAYCNNCNCTQISTSYRCQYCGVSYPSNTIHSCPQGYWGSQGIWGIQQSPPQQTHCINCNGYFYHAHVCESKHAAVNHLVKASDLYEKCVEYCLEIASLKKEIKELKLANSTRSK